MLDKVKQSQKFEWSLSFLTKKMVQRALDELLPGEELVGIYLGKIGIVRGVIAITQDRILLVNASIISEDVKSIRWSHISDIHYSRGIFKGVVEIDLLKDNVQVKTYKKTADKIYQDVRTMFFKHQAK